MARNTLLSKCMYTPWQIKYASLQEEHEFLHIGNRICVIVQNFFQQDKCDVMNDRSVLTSQKFVKMD
jgi:hypothetical protein